MLLTRNFVQYFFNFIVHSQNRTTCSGPLKTALNNVFLSTVFNIVNYHSLYSILDFDWLIHLQITGANTLLSMRTLKMFRQPQ